MASVPDRPRRARWLYFGLGWLMFGMGCVGIFLPLVPTTPLMLLALWAFARSSRRFHDWLREHRTFGPPLRRFQDHRVIPTRVKVLAISCMVASLGYMVLGARVPWPAVGAAAAVMLAGVIYILRCPGRV